MGDFNVNYTALVAALKEFLPHDHELNMSSQYNDIVTIKGILPFLLDAASLFYAPVWSRVNSAAKVRALTMSGGKSSRFAIAAVPDTNHYDPNNFPGEWLWLTSGQRLIIPGRENLYLASLPFCSINWRNANNYPILTDLTTHALLLSERTFTDFTGNQTADAATVVFQLLFPVQQVSFINWSNARRIFTIVSSVSAQPLTVYMDNMSFPLLSGTTLKIGVNSWQGIAIKPTVDANGSDAVVTITTD
jgi:hypothetical protein